MSQDPSAVVRPVPSLPTLPPAGTEHEHEGDSRPTSGALQQSVSAREGQHASRVTRPTRTKRRKSSGGRYSQTRRSVSPPRHVAQLPPTQVRNRPLPRRPRTSGGPESEPPPHATKSRVESGESRHRTRGTRHRRPHTADVATARRKPRRVRRTQRATSPLAHARGGWATGDRRTPPESSRGSPGSTSTQSPETGVQTSRSADNSRRRSRFVCTLLCPRAISHALAFRSSPTGPHFSPVQPERGRSPNQRQRHGSSHNSKFPSSRDSSRSPSPGAGLNGFGAPLPEGFAWQPPAIRTSEDDQRSSARSWSRLSMMSRIGSCRSFASSAVRGVHFSSVG